MSYDLILAWLKSIDAQNKAIIILLSQLARKTQRRGQPLRAAFTRQKITITKLKLQIKTLQKENHELHGFLNEETKKVKFLK